ncbi:MDR family MFS transporter [Vibrio gangliei]|uniref:MDR family MFS transporter n=1 Tax=Vibrio gangliei TaxID=2077090 RepID=UPI000D019C4A|nr:MDR family MFS transporter [Vibrio gangliei]
MTEKTTVSPQKIFLSVALVIALGSLEKSIVTTPLPIIGNALNAGNALTWVVTAYLLAATAVLPVYGKLSDILGRVKMLYIGISLFVLGSAACGFAQDLSTLIIARIVQGIGGGGLIALAFTVIADCIPAREVGKYQGFISMVYAVSSIAGPLLGGYFAEHLSWRWVFWINIPLGLLAVFLIRKNLSHLNKKRDSKFDWFGAMLLMLSSTSLLLLLSPEAELPSLWTGGAFIASILLLILVERRVSDPMLPARLAKLPNYLVCILLILCSQLLMFAILVYLPMQMQWQMGFSASTSGEIMVIFMFSVTAGAYCGGKLVNKSGETKRYAIFGFLLAALSFALIQQHVYPAISLGLAGLGIGFTLPSVGVMVQNVLPAKDRGIGMSLFNFGRELGGAVGVAACSSVFQFSLSKQGVEPQASLANYSHAVLASGFSSIYLLMAIMALVAMFITLIALKKQTLATEIKHD